MTQSQNQPDKDQQEGLTREFNFPKPWIKDYNPQIHGIKPGMGYGQESASPASGQPPAAQPMANPGQQPSYPANQAAAPGPGGQVQWNATGVYGGEPEKQKGLPAWVWTLISAGILIVILLILFFVILK